MKEKVAIIGTGIAGMTCAWYLRDLYDVHLFEKEDRPGGHTHTVTIDREGKPIPVDTGFMVYNDRTYPNLIRLFDELKVQAHPTDMSFGVHLRQLPYFFASSGLNGFFAQRKNLLSPRHYRLLAGIRHFFQKAGKFLEDGTDSKLSVFDFFIRESLDPWVRDAFVLPMAAAIWSTHNRKIHDYPALSLFRFMDNHGLLGFRKQHQWKTLKAGSRQYRDALLGALKHPPVLNQPVQSVKSEGDQVVIRLETGREESFDFAVLATHADQALKLLESPTVLQGTCLSAFRYSVNRTILHSDSSVMPPVKRAWTSWNYRVEQENESRLPDASTHYWMNNLQNLETETDYFVSVDYSGRIAPEKICWQSTYRHPSFDGKAISAQARLDGLNEEGNLFFCGSYFRYGFHEDAHVSALKVVRNLKRRKGLDHEILSV